MVTICIWDGMSLNCMCCCRQSHFRKKGFASIQLEEQSVMGELQLQEHETAHRMGSREAERVEHWGSALSLFFM